MGHVSIFEKDKLCLINSNCTSILYTSINTGYCHIRYPNQNLHTMQQRSIPEVCVQLTVTSKTQRWVLDLHERSSLFKNHLHTKHIAHQPTRRSLKKQQKKLYCSWPNKNTWDVTTLSSPNLSQKKTSKHRMLVSRKQKRLFLFVFFKYCTFS